MELRLLFVLIAVLLDGVSARLPRGQVEHNDLSDLAGTFRNDSVYITMRDGVNLYTVISYPNGGGRYGCVIERTPYGTNVNPLVREWLPLGFAVVIQDQRGSSDSRDTYFQYWRYDGQDAYDTFEWISQQPWSNGKIFLLGTSASGNAVYAGLLFSPPWITAIGPVVATANGYPSTYQGGAFRQSLSQNWLLALGFIRTLQDVKENEPFGPWWDSVTLEGKEDLCNVPGVHSAGWFDIFQNENLDAFNACQYVSTNPGARGQQQIVVDPHGHCGGGDYDWPNGRINLASDLRQALFLRTNGLEVPDSLNEKIKDISAITLYIMGPEDAKIGNYWTTITTWPQFLQVTYYLHGDRSLTTIPPFSNQNGNTTYTYDPSDPVRTIGGTELFLPCGPRDQTSLESRQDVITFTSQPLSEDTAIVGDVEAYIYVSSDAVDTDFTVKITDVYPDGRSILLTDGIIRMRWRESNQIPISMAPGVVYRVRVHLWKTAYIFNAGHAIRVAISSSNNPRFTPNPNNGLPITEEGEEVIARNTIHHSLQYSSQILLPIVNLNDIPHNYFP